MLNSFLDKKNLQEIISIFKQHVQYQYSQKEEVADINVVQQDKINRFLNCYSTFFEKYLIQNNTYQHFDYYRILSKYIKVFNFEKGKKFQRNNYDGLYIILKGFIQEIVIEEESKPDGQGKNDLKKKGKGKLNDQNKMSKIVNMVMGINRMKGSSNDVSQRESVQIMPSINTLGDEQPTNEPTLESNSHSHKEASKASLASPFSQQRNIQNDLKIKNSHFAGVNEFEYLPNSPDPVHQQSSHNPQSLHSKLWEMKRLLQNNSEQNQEIKDSGYIIENTQNPQNASSQMESASLKNNEKKITKNYKDLKVVISPVREEKNKLQREDTENLDEKVDNVPELHQISSFNTPMKASPHQVHENRQYLFSPFPLSPQTSQQVHQASPVSPLDHTQNKQGEQIPHLNNMNKASHQLKKKMSILIAMQPKSSTPFAEYANKPFKILTNGDIIDLITVNDQQRKYFVQEIEDSICLYIGKKSMQKAFKEQLTQLRFKADVLEKFFYNVPSSKILKLSYHFYEKTLFKNQIIYKTGESRPHYIYIIKSGEVQISECIQPQKISKSSQELTQNSGNSDKEDNLNDSQSQQSQINPDDLQSLCRKKLFNNSNNIMNGINSLEIVKQNKVLCSLGEEEIFGIDEIILQKETRQYQAVVTSSSAEFYVIPEELFENFRQSESESILSWFKQKEVFYQQQRIMHKRIKVDKITQKSSDGQFIINKKRVQQACQYLFQEDEQTFNNRLDDLHEKKIIKLKSYHTYKQYIQSSSSLNPVSSSFTGINDQSSTSPKNDSAGSEKTSNRETQNDTFSKFHPQNSAKKPSIFFSNKMSQLQLSKQHNSVESSSQLSIDLGFETSRMMLKKQDQLKKSMQLNLQQVESVQRDNPYQLTDRPQTTWRSINLVSPTSSSTNNYFQNTQDSNAQNQNEIGMKSKPITTFTKVYSTITNAPADPTQTLSLTNISSSNKYDSNNLDQYKINIQKSDGIKKSQFSQSQISDHPKERPYLKNIKKGITTESLCNIDTEQSQSFFKQGQSQSEQQQQQSLVHAPPSLEYVSKQNIGQVPSGDTLNLGRIHHMIKSNTQIIKKKLNLKGKNSFFSKPIFEELKKENIKQIAKILQKKTSQIQEEKQKTYQPLSERWSNTAKTMENSKKFSQYIKTSTSLNNNLSPGLNQKEVLLTQSFYNLQTPRSFQSTGQFSTKSLTHFENTVPAPSVTNIHMENKRKLQKSNEPYFTRPFSRADQRSQGGDINYSSHSKHRTLQSSQIKIKSPGDEKEDIPLLLQLKKIRETKTLHNFQTIITSQFSLADRQPLSPKNEFTNF